MARTAPGPDPGLSSRQPRFYYGWVMVGALGASLIATQGALMYLFGLLLVPMQHEMGWNRAEISGAYSASSFILGVAGLYVGRVVDRRGSRLVMVTGSLLGAACMVGVANAHSVWQLYLFWGLGLGVAGGLVSLQVASTAVSNWFTRRRGRALAVLTTINGLTAPLYLPLAGWLIVSFGWRQAVTILAGLFLVVALLSLLLRRRPEDSGLRIDGDPPRAEPGDAGSAVSAATARAVSSGTSNTVSVVKPVEGLTLSEALRHPGFWILTGSTFLSAMALGGVTVHQIPYMIGRGVSPVLAGSVVGTLGLLSIPGRFFFNASADWLGARRVLVVVIGIQAAGLAILTLATSISWLFVYAFTYGIAAGSAFGLRAALMANMYGRTSLGSISAVFQLFTYTAVAIGPIAAGLMYDRFHSYDLTLRIATVITFASIIGLLMIPRTRLEQVAQRRGAIS